MLKGKIKSDKSDIEAVTFEENEKEEYDLNEKNKINNIYVAELTSYTNGLQMESVLSSLVSGYYLIPKFQRKFTWKKTQIANLALSLIKDVPIPPIYLYVNERKKHVVLDGQQRVTALFLYFNDLWYTGLKDDRRLDFNSINEKNRELKQKEEELVELAVNTEISKRLLSAKRKGIKADINRIKAELKTLGVCRGQYFIQHGTKDVDISFSTFSDDEKEFLKRKRLDITIVECKSNNAPKVYADIFRLLNTGGKLLSSQEIRNGVYWELELYDRLFEVNKNPNWRKIYGKESDVSKDIEILLKILALNSFTEINNDKVNIVYDGAFTWSNIMEDYSLKASKWNSDQVNQQIELLTNFLNRIIIVKDFNGKKLKCNKAVFEASFVVYTKLNCTDNIDFNWLCGLDKAKEFQKGEVLSNKQSVENRLSKALCIFREKYGV